MLSSPKEQNASGPIRPPSWTWYMIYAPLPLSSADREYLLLGPERERNLFHPSGPRLPSCRDRTLSDMSRRSCKLVTDIMDVPLAYNPLFYKNHHVNCSDRNKNTRYCRNYCSLRYFIRKREMRNFTRITRQYLEKNNILYTR